MIAEDLLERGLAEAAGDYDVPAGAVDRIREQLAPSVAAEPHRWPPRPSRRAWVIIAGAAAVILVVLPFALGGTNSVENHVAPNAAGDAGSGASPVNQPAAVPPKSAAGVAGTSSGGSGSAHRSSAATGFGAGHTSDQAAAPLVPVPAAPDRVIKTGELDLQVAKGQVGHTLDQLTGLATLERGYVSDSRTSEGGYAPSGQVTLRVPVAAFEDTVLRVRRLTRVKVLALQTSGQDVTSKFVDLQARIKALQATRAVFLTLLSRATTIGETLAVQQHVTDVQSSIEQLQGQLKVLASSSAMSTLTVTVDQKVAQPAAKPSHHKSGLHKAFDRSVSRFVRGAEAIIGGIGPVLLAALVIGVAWLAATVGYRRLRRRMV